MNFLRKNFPILFALFMAINLYGFSVAFGQDAPQQENPCPTTRVPAGTGVILQPAWTITTKSAQAGESIPLLVAAPVKVDGTIVIRAGAPARGVVITSKAASSWGGAGELSLEAKSAQAIDGSEILLTGSSSRKGNDSHGTSAAVAVGTGILCLPLAFTGAAVKGEEGKMQQNVEFVARTINEQTVTVYSELKQKEIQQQQEDTVKKQKAEAAIREQQMREEEAKKKKATGKDE